MRKNSVDSEACVVVGTRRVDGHLMVTAEVVQVVASGVVRAEFTAVCTTWTILGTSGTQLETGPEIMLDIK